MPQRDVRHRHQSARGLTRGVSFVTVLGIGARQAMFAPSPVTQRRVELLEAVENLLPG